MNGARLVGSFSLTSTADERKRDVNNDSEIFLGICNSNRSDLSYKEDGIKQLLRFIPLYCS